MKIAQDKFRIETTLSENQLEELLNERFFARPVSFWERISEGFAGQLYSDKKELNSAFFYRKVKCAVVTGYYVAEGERGTTVHFDMHWPAFDVLSFILGNLVSAIVPFIFSRIYYVLPMSILIGWPLIAFAFCAGSIGYYYIPGIKHARTRILDFFGANIRSVIDD
jgi:hypothetical protein